MSTILTCRLVWLRPHLQVGVSSVLAGVRVEVGAGVGAGAGQIAVLVHVQTVQTRRQTGDAACRG